MRKYDTRHLLQYVAHLGFVALEELATSGYVEEEIFDEELCAYSALLYFLTEDLRPFDFDKSAQFIGISACTQLDLRYCGD